VKKSAYFIGWTTKNIMRNTLKIGSRGSALALIQAEQVKTKLLALNPNLDIVIISIQTEGDINQSAPLHEIGGKGVFIKSIEKALINNDIDMAVHSLKDITATLEPNTELAAYLSPESRNDCLILSKNTPLSALTELPNNSSIATGSLRRKLLLQHINPSWLCKNIRGNVGTRIQRCKEGYADALILSEAGLLRLNQKTDISLSLNPHEFIPAPGQGVVAVQTKSNDSWCLALLQQINDTKQAFLSQSELAIVNNVGLDCNYPLGLYAWTEQDTLHMRAFWGNQSCTKHFTDYATCPIENSHLLIQDLSEKITLSIHD